MRTSVLWLALTLAVLTQSGCTPFFYGGVVVFGDPKDEPNPEGRPGG